MKEVTHEQFLVQQQAAQDIKAAWLETSQNPGLKVGTKVLCAHFDSASMRNKVSSGEIVEIQRNTVLNEDYFFVKLDRRYGKTVKVPHECVSLIPEFMLQKPGINS